MKTFILYYNFFDPSRNERMIGGVETYIWNLSKIIAERGSEPIMLQPADEKFETKIEHLKVMGVPPRRGRIRPNKRKDLYEFALSVMDKEKDALIFGADHISVPTRYPKAVSIQHGISWDLPGKFLRTSGLGVFPFVPDWLCKKYMARRCAWYFNNCKNRVCVDYNFLNWYRTQISDEPQGNIWVIPNFVNPPNDFQPDLKRHDKKPVKVVFARRFVEIRGLSLMVLAAKRMLEMNSEVEFCFAGEGSGQNIVLKEFAKEKRVSIIRYLPEESFEIHKKFDIAVVPSLGSEGTSFSLAEAMISGCAVIATNVGGMTNMVIDGYNGRLINPTIDSLVAVLTELISDGSKRKKLAMNAMATALEGFSFGRWREGWFEVLEKVEKSNLDG